MPYQLHGHQSNEAEHIHPGDLLDDTAIVEPADHQSGEQPEQNPVDLFSVLGVERCVRRRTVDFQDADRGDSQGYGQEEPVKVSKAKWLAHELQGRRWPGATRPTPVCRSLGACWPCSLTARRFLTVVAAAAFASPTRLENGGRGCVGPLIRSM